MGRGRDSRFRYAFDNFMSKGGMSVFLALMCLFLGAIVLVALLRFVANLIAPQESTAELPVQWWLSFLQVADAGSIGEDTESNALNRVVGIVALFLGMVLFSSLVAFITSQFEAMIERMKKGESEVIERDHSLILGFNDRALEIARELVIGRASERGGAIVILAEADKEEMDAFFRERLADRGRTRIVTRSGPTSRVQLLGKVAAKDARSIVILNGAAADAPAADKALADARVLKTIMAVVSCSGPGGLPPILAELHVPGKQALARKLSNRVTVVNEHSILAKLMVQTARISGLAQVYDQLVGFEGAEFYFHRPAEGWGGLSYGELLFRYPGCSPLGVRDRAGTVHLNPPADRPLVSGDEAVLLAEDDSLIAFSTAAAIRGAVPAPSRRPAARRTERQLIVGWGEKAPLVIDQYCEYLVEGSRIDVVADDPEGGVAAALSELAGRHPGIGIGRLEISVEEPGFASRLRPEQYENVIILSGDGGDAELRDSTVISILLEFRQYFRDSGARDLRTQLITEVSDYDNISVIKEAGVKDFLISNQFVSKIYAQVSEDPSVLAIYEDLFGEEGSEVYIKPVGLYFEVLPSSLGFGELCAAALARGESCFGIKLAAEEGDASRGFGIHLNPPKGTVFSLTEGDALIVLAEDEG
jgi:hypothetical protein